MNINFSKNILYSANVPIKQSIEFYEKWYANISNLIYEYLKNEEVSFLSYYAPDKAIGSDFCTDNHKIKTYNNTFYYYDSTYLSREDVNLLIEQPEFYLGTTILIKGSYSLENAFLIALCWENELITSGKEIFRMDSDGYNFYSYNMLNEKFDSIFQLFLEKVKNI